MSSKSLSRMSLSLLRRSLQPIRSPASRNCAPIAPIARSNGLPAAATRAFHATSAFQGILPESSNPPHKESEASEQPTVPTDISTREYNQRADEFIEELVTRLEAEQERRVDLEVEYSAGVLEISVPGKGTYIINKQPANKQIWLSSPESGPKRFDWVVMGEGLNQKEGAGIGDWIYLRDGTSFTALVRRELGVDLGVSDDAPR